MSVKRDLKELIEIECACDDYLRKYDERHEPLRRVYSTRSDHELDIDKFTVLMFEKMNVLDKKYVKYSFYHLVRYLDNEPDDDDPELIRIIGWVKESYTRLIIDIVSKQLLE